MLLKDQLTYLKTTLQDEETSLRRRLDENDDFGLDFAMIKESLGELSNYDNHPADHGSELFEREKDFALREHAEEQLSDIERALDALDRGTYGVCQICQKEIPYERLEALPTATRCVEHSPNTFVSFNRPVEEEVLRPPFGQFEYDERDSNFYDAEDAWQEVARYGTSETPSDFFEQEKNDYNEMYIEADEWIGFVEPIEGFIITDMEGNNIDVVPNVIHDIYEQTLDHEEIISAVGGLGAPSISYDEDMDIDR